MEAAKTGADELKDNGAEEAGYVVCEAKQRSMAAAGGGKIKFRRKCGELEGGRDPVEETRRLRQKEDPRVRGRARRRGEPDSAAVRASGREGGREKGGRDRPGKESQKLTLAVWCEKGPSSQGHRERQMDGGEMGEPRPRRGGSLPDRSGLSTLVSRLSVDMPPSAFQEVGLDGLGPPSRGCLGWVVSGLS